MTILSMWSTLETIRHSVVNKDLGAVMDVAGLMACIAAGIAILKVVKIYMSGPNMDPWDFFKPLVLLMLVCNFETLVLGPVNGLCGIISRESADIFNMDPNRYVGQWAENMQEIERYTMVTTFKEYQDELIGIAEDRSMVGAFFSKLWLAIKKMLMYTFSVKSLTFGGIVGGVLFLIVKILLFAQQMLCCIFLIIHSLLGPYVLALSIIPGYESGFRTWIGRHLQLSMWIPMGYIIMALNLSLTDKITSLIVSGGGILSLEWTMIVLQIVALVSVANVPKMVTWVIHTMGSNDAHKTFSNIARKIAKI